MREIKGSKHIIFTAIFVLFLSLSLLPVQSDISRSEESFYQPYIASVKEGKSHKEKGNFEEAIESFNKGLKSAVEYKDKNAQVDCYSQLGLLYWNIGRLVDSLKNYTYALSLAKEINSKKRQEELNIVLEIYDLYSKGKDYRSSNQNEKSVKSFERAINFAREIGSKEHELKCLRQLSITYLALDNLHEFNILNEIALNIARQLRHKREEGKCLINIGLYFQKSNNYSKALSCYESSLRIMQDLQNNEDESACLNNLGLVFREIGSYEKALDYLMQALALDRALKNDIYISYDLNNIGITYRLKGLYTGQKENFYKALTFYHDSLELAKKSNDISIEIKVLNNIGSLFTYLENFHEALIHLKSGYEKAERVHDIEAKGMILNNLGMVYSNQGIFEEAKKYYASAIEFGQQINAGHILWEAYFGLGQCYAKENEYNSAIHYCKKAIDVIDRIRSQIVIDTYKAGFVRNKLKVYEFLINLLYEKNANSSSADFIKEIFHIVENAKARAFLETLGESKIDVREKLSPELKSIDKEISDRISSLNRKLYNAGVPEDKKKEIFTKLRKAEDEYLTFLSKMRLETPVIANMVSPEPCQLEQVQKQLLDEKTVLIEYFLGEKKSFMFLITENSFYLFTLPSRGEINKSLKAFLEILSDPPNGKFREILAAKRLYKELFSPLEEVIPDKVENLIIIPDGILYYLPFEALIPQAGFLSEKNDYLISRFRISYSPSSSALLFLTREKKVRKFEMDLLAIGDPDYTFDGTITKQWNKNPAELLKELYQNQGFNFSPLPYSKKEVKKISAFFPKKRRNLYLKENAIEHTIKSIPLDKYQVIHFACHGLLDERFPFRSALVLSVNNDGKEDGFLHVREIYNLRVLAELVVLSACQTGKGKLERGEGVLGLPRIFFYSGARSVVSTLWEIGDKSTADFMEFFYYYLTQGNETSQALRLAKLKMLKSKYSHPFFWAAFILNGKFSTRISIN